MANFIGAKLQNILSAPVPDCGGVPWSQAAIVVPLSAPCLGGLSFGGKRTVQRSGAASSVQISIVTAVHDNSLPANLLSDPFSTNLASQGLAFQPAPPVGYVVTISNGLIAYLSGDTGQTTDMRLVVADEYQANLAVINIGDNFMTGPEEAAFAMNELVRPQSVIPSHSLEVATSGGKVIPGTNTAKFLSLIKMPGYVRLSGRTMEFDGAGRCVAGCS